MGIILPITYYPLPMTYDLARSSWFPSLLLIYYFVAFLTETNTLAVFEHPPSHTSGISAFATHHHEVGNLDRILLFHDTSLATVCPWPHVTFDKVDFFHYGPVLLG
jgi:hypothetical protein